MADIELAIKIPEELYKSICKMENPICRITLMTAIAKGTPLIDVDAVSREAAKAVVKKHFGQSIPWNSQPITEDLDALPTVQPKEKVGEWIYVKDRLPEEEGRYLCTYKYGNAYGLIIRKFINGGWYTSVENYIRGVEEHDIIAWMPLPEPCNEREE